MTAKTMHAFRDLWMRLVNNPDYARSVVTSYGGIALNIVVQLILVPLYLSHLGKQQFGVLMILLGAINYVNVGVGWASSGAQRIIGEMAARDDREGLAETYSIAKVLLVGYALAVAGLALGGTWLGRDLVLPAAGLDHRIMMQTVALAGAYLVVQYDFNVDRTAMIAAGRQAMANGLAILGQAAFAVVAVLLLLEGYGLPGVMAAFLCGAVASRAGSWLVLRRMGIDWRWTRWSNGGVRRRLVGSMGRGYALYGALILTLLQADVLILGWLGGPQMVAEFVLIWKIADVGIQALWRIPESLQPYLVHMDVRADHERLRRVYRQGHAWMTAMAAVAAVGYAALGPAIVRLWVGPEHAPDAPWAFVLAGAAVFWLVSARLPAILAFSLLRLRALNRAAAIEVGAKLALALALFPIAGYYSPLIAINVAHACGVAFLYRQLARQTDTG